MPIPFFCLDFAMEKGIVIDKLKIETARKAGYSDEEISSYLGKSYGLENSIKSAFDNGYSPTEVVDFISSAYTPKPDVMPERTFGGTLKDAGITALKGAIGVPEMAVGLADLVTGGRVGKFVEDSGIKFRESKDILDSYKSDAQKAAEQRVNDAEGFVDTVKTAVQNPSVIASTVGESIPSMLAGGVIGRGVTAVVPKISPAIAGAVGEGFVGAGSAAESTRQQTDDGYLTNKQAGLSALSGAGTAAIGAAGGKIAQKLGIADIDTLAAGGVSTVGKKSIIRKLAEGGVSEGVLEELPQSVQEQMLSNAALDRPLFENVDNAAALGLLSGTAMGAGAQILPNSKTNQPQTNNDRLTISQGDNAADEATAAALQAQYDAETAKQEADAALAAIPEATSVDDAIKLASETIKAPIESGTGLLGQINQYAAEAIPAADILGSDNVSDLQNDVSTELANSTIEGADNNAQGSVGNLSDQPTGRDDTGRTDNAAGTLAQSSGADISTGNAVAGNDAVNRPFAQATDEFLPQMRNMTVDPTVIKQIDDELALRGLAGPATVPAETKQPETVLQNRDRSQPESINQMRSIAANPDPSRLSFSRDAANGAPVVAGQLPASAVLGKLDHAITANNRKLPMQYAVVEASDVIASHDVNGNPIAEYGKGGKLQAIGGNGRIAGLQEAFRNNNGTNYIQGIAEDSALHGVPADAIRSMKNPVLIRVMNSEDITPTIGDELNGRTNMGLSVLEQAKTDTARLKLEALDFNENGEVTQDAIKAFVMAMPENERNELMDGGRVGRKAEERLMAAVFNQAYGDDELVRIYSQAQDIESKAVITALANAAPTMARLTGAGNLDIRSIVANAAKVAVNSSREGVSLAKLAAQGDMELGEDVMAIVRFMAQNIRRPKLIGEELTKAAQFAYEAANQKTMAMFDLPNITRDDVIRKVANDYQTRTENLAEQGRGQFDGSAARNEADNRAGQENSETVETTNAGQQAQVTDNFTLSGQTNEDINAGIAAQEAAAKAARDQAKADEAARIEAERIARQEIAADSFDLTPTGKTAKETQANDAKQIDNQFAGQTDLLAAPVKTLADYTNDGKQAFLQGLPRVAPQGISAMYGAGWYKGWDKANLDAPIEAAQSDTQQSKDQARFADNKVFTADKVAAARARLKSKLNTLNSGIDPELLIDGMTIAGAYIESGVRKFSDYAKAMTDDFGDSIKPYLLSFYEAARAYPGIDKEGMTDFDAASAEHQALLTPSVLEQAKEVIGQGLVQSDKAKAKPNGQLKLTQDWGVDDINGYDSDRDDGAGGEIKTQFLNEAKKYLNQVAKLMEAEGYEPHKDQRGRLQKAVSVNEAGVAVSGEVSLTMRKGNAGVYVDIGTSAIRGVTGNHPQGVSVMIRATDNAETDRYATKGQNIWLSTDLNATELANKLMQTAERYVKNTLQAEQGANDARTNQTEQVQPGRAQGNLLTEQPRSGTSKPMDARVGRASESADAGRTVSGGISETSGTGTQGAIGSNRNESPSGSRETGNAGNITGTANPVNDFEITDETGIGEGSLAQKYNDNIAAIKLIKTLEAESRQATPEERNQLAKYNGFGALSKVFEKNNPKYQELKNLLTEEEYAAAKASILNAYYTSPAIVKSMYDAVSHLGFKGGRVLEPSLGSGNFFGMMPAGMRNKSKLNGVELDVITSRLAKYLYPNANIAVATGFEKYQAPQGYFDLVISNPPFGSEQLRDSEKADYSGFSIHNFFIAKSIDKLRDNGIMAVVVSHSFMDAMDSRAREWISKRANLLGAVRLPNTAFKDNAGTEVITDILFFQKTSNPQNADAWINATNNGDYSFNDYFYANPRNVLGRITDTTSQFGKTFTIEPLPGNGTLAEQLREFISRLPNNVYVEPTQRIEVLDSADNTVPDSVKVGTFYTDETGAIRQRMPDVLGAKRSVTWEAPNAKAQERMQGMMKLRDLLRNQMRLERDPMATEKEIESNRKQLNQSYDDFVKKQGYLNSSTNRRLFMDDTESALLQALEVDYDQGVTKAKALATGMDEKPASAQKADIFKRRVLFPPSDSITVNNAKDALLASLNVKGVVDADYMAEVYNKSASEVIDELGDVVYEDPNKGYVTADEYLSGDVKTKLAEAKAKAATDSKYARNVAALEKVIPADKLPSEIYASAGANWIPADVYAQFASEITGIPVSDLEYNYVKATAMWLSDKTRNGDTGKMTAEFGTQEVNAFDLFHLLINGKAPEVKETIGYGADRKTVVNIEKTEAARSKLEKIKEAWNSWIFKDADRADRLATIYNEKHNRTVPRKFDGSHMQFYGMSPAITLRAHQKDVVWRAIQDRNVLLDHVVGAGKTMAMASIAMEMKRLGIARKPVFVVPNHLTLQWRSEFTKLYPASNILAATPEDFAKDKREKLFSKMVTGSYDAIIIGHSSLTKIGLPAEVEERMYQEQVKELSDAIEAAKTARGDRGITRDMEKIKRNLEAKIVKLKDKSGKKDNVVTFDELGIDALFVDEMHEFKNLFFTTQMQRTAGLGDPEGSGKALDLFMKIRFMTETYGEDAPLITATGTPVSNSLAEMFTMQRYMKYQEMKRQDLHLFDAWAKQFGEIENVYEVAPSGVGYRQSTRFSKFKNLPALMGSYTRFADIITMQDLKDQAAAEVDPNTGKPKVFPVPKLKTGGPINVVAKRSELQRDFFGVPQLAVDENTGAIQFEVDPENAIIEQNKEGKYQIILQVKDENGNVIGRRSVGDNFDTKEDAELELVTKSLTPKTFIDPKSLLGQFANLAQLTRESNKKINALSLTDLASKAGLDYRLIDPSAPDFAGSKINLSVTNMVQLWKDTAKDKGTQLVFCDLSVPNSARNDMSSKERRIYVRDRDGEITHKAKGVVYAPEGFEGFPFYITKGRNGFEVYEAVSGTLVRDYGLEDKAAAKAWAANYVENESNRDRIFTLRDTKTIDQIDIDEYRDANELELADDGSNEISIADLEALSSSSKFSVYDDIKAKLIASGVPENQIAFIHDYNTPKKKEELFKRVNSGDVRFLFGSTKKLGAGTNVQKRLVGLHHIDAPWKPSDLEQREGRIIRQGNELYARDPDNFEVSIWRYATEQTYDTRRWQLLEHKAAGIEQLRKYTGVTEIDDVASEAANSADMKAAASGNPLILEETKLRNEVKRLINLEKAHADSKYAMARKIRSNTSYIADYLPNKIAEYQDMISAVSAYPIPADKAKVAAMKVDGKVVSTREAAEEAIAALALKVRSLATINETPKVIEYRGIKFTVERGIAMNSLKLSSPDGLMHTYSEKEGVSPSGLMTRFNNYIDSFESRIKDAEQAIKNAKAENESLKSRVNDPFEYTEQLKEAQAKHASVQRKLMKSSQLESVPENQRPEFDRLVKERKETLKKLGFEKAIKESEAEDNLILSSNEINGAQAYSTVEEKVPANKMLSIATISQEVEKLVSKFSAPIPVIIKETGGVVDGGTVSGMVSRGKIYLFQDGISDIAGVQISLWHELLHYGLRRFLTKEQYISKLNDLYLKDAWIRGRANDWLKTDVAKSLVGKESNSYIVARGVDEALAEISESGNRGGYNNNGLKSKARREVARWIAKLADFFGFAHAANLYRGVSNDEARELIKNVFVKLEENADPAPDNLISDNSDFTSNIYSIRNPQSSLTPEWKAPDASKFDSVVYKLQDKNIDLKRVTQAIKDAGNEISDRWNAYLQEELYHGRTAKRTQEFLKNDLEPLITEMRMRGVAMADFEEYLWARHAEERNIQIAKVNPDMPDGGSGMTTAEARDYLANLSAADKSKYEALARRIDLINAKSRQVLVDYGLESAGTIMKWEGAYKHYVPLMREDMELGFGNGTGQGFSVKGNASKRATGSNRPVVDIIANIAQQYERNIIRGEKNRVATALIGLAKLNPNDDFWKVDTPPTIKSINQATGLVEERTDPNYKNRDNVVVARLVNKRGEIEERSVIFNQFDERAMRMAAAIKNLDQDQIGELLGMASGFTRYFASINTQYNPVFGVINITRDVQGALLNLSSTPLSGKQKEILANTGKAWLGIYKDLRQQRKTGSPSDAQWATLFEEFQREGGQTGYRDMYANAKERSEALKNALDPTWWKDSKIGKVISVNGVIAAPEQWMYDKAIKPIFDWLSDYNNSLENAVRLSVYKSALDAGQTKQQAASIAKNISVNFNRKGASGRQIGALYAFFNASVQGTARIAETVLQRDNANGKLSLSKAGKVIFQGGLLLGAMQALVLAAAGYDDDEPPEFVRDRSLIIPLDPIGADGKYVTIPMPLGYNAIPATGRMITEWALSGGEDTGKRIVKWMNMLLDVTNPIGNAGLSLQTITPTVIDPMAALAENKDFTGRPIAREDISSLDPTPGFTRSRDKALDLSVAIARGINWATGGTDAKQGVISPTADQLEYLAGQFTGGVGRETIKLGTTVDSLFTGEELPTYKIPLFGRFYGDTTGQSSQGSEFYNNIRKLNEHQAEIKLLQENDGDLDGYLQDNPEALYFKQADRVYRNISKLRKNQRVLKEQGADKADIKAIDEAITELMTNFNDAIREAKEKEPA